MTLDAVERCVVGTGNRAMEDMTRERPKEELDAGCVVDTAVQVEVTNYY